MGKPKAKYTVRPPKIMLTLDLVLIAFMVIMMIIFTILTPPPHIAMYVCVTIFILVPATIMGLWIGMYKIEVDGTNISVRRKLGLCHYQFDITEVKYVHYVTTGLVDGAYINVIMETEDGKKTNVEPLMENSDKFVKYLNKYVGESKKKYIKKKK